MDRHIKWLCLEMTKDCLTEIGEKFAASFLELVLECSLSGCWRADDWTQPKTVVLKLHVH